MMKTIIIITAVLLSSIVASCQDNDLKTIEIFAENFVATKMDSSIIPNIYIDNIHWGCVINKAHETDSLKTNIYLSLILLKLYLAHLECCNQAYTLHLKNPIVYTFLEINGFYKSETVKSVPNELIGDLVWSSLVYDWMKGKVNFLNDNYKYIVNDSSINSELLKIDKQLE